MTRKEIQNIIDDMHLMYKVDEDGDLVLLFNADEDYGYSIAVFMMCQGDGDIINMQGISVQEFSKNDFGELIVFCNKWNTERRWPTAFVREGRNGNPEVMCRRCIDGFTYSVSDDFIKSIVKGMLAGTFQFYKELGKELK